MVSVKFGMKWVIIKESQKIGKIMLAELLRSNLMKEALEEEAKEEKVNKKFDSFQYKPDEKIEVKCKYTPLTNFSLPSKDSEILDIHFVEYFWPVGMQKFKK